MNDVCAESGSCGVGQPVSVQELDKTRDASPDVARSVDEINNDLLASARAGANPAWAERWYRSDAMRDEVGRRFSPSYNVTEWCTWGMADPDYGTRYHLRVVERT